MVMPTKIPERTTAGTPGPEKVTSEVRHEEDVRRTSGVVPDDEVGLEEERLRGTTTARTTTRAAAMAMMGWRLTRAGADDGTDISLTAGTVPGPQKTAHTLLAVPGSH